MANLRLRVGLFVFFLAGGLATPYPAAAQTPTPWVQLTIVHVNPSMVDEFMAVQREFMAHAKEAGTPWRLVSRTAVFGDTYRFVIATPVERLASFDETPDSDPSLAALINRVQKCVTSRQSYAVRTMPDMDNPLPEGEEPDLMVMSLSRVAAGRGPDYLDLMASDFLPHFDAAGVHHVTGALTFGGESGFIHVFYVNDFEELDEGSPVVRALGTEGAQVVTAKLSGIVTRSELWLARRLPAVSYGPSSDSSNP